MTQTQTRQIVDTLQAWMAGSQLADDLIPRTEALLASLTVKKSVIRARAQEQAESQNLDTASMSNAELFAYYKRIALREDVRFFLAHVREMPNETRAEAQALLIELETRKATPADRKVYNRLTDQWRRHETKARPMRIQAARIERKRARAALRMAA